LSIVISSRKLRAAPSSTARIIRSSRSRSSFPASSRPFTSRASPKYSASPSFTHGGRLEARRASANWWKPSCWRTLNIFSRLCPSTHVASPDAPGLRKKTPPEFCALNPNPSSSAR
jgi:hypothetical protein